MSPFHCTPRENEKYMGLWVLFCSVRTMAFGIRKRETEEDDSKEKKRVGGQ